MGISPTGVLPVAVLGRTCYIITLIGSALLHGILGFVDPVLTLLWSHQPIAASPFRNTHSAFTEISRTERVGGYLLIDLVVCSNNI